MSLVTTAVEYMFWSLCMVLFLIAMALKTQLVGPHTQDVYLWSDILFTGLQVLAVLGTVWMTITATASVPWMVAKLRSVFGSTPVTAR
ncbi:MAG: hypothetical protein AAF713_09665 [Pseudomonadota bacterium]